MQIEIQGLLNSLPCCLTYGIRSNAQYLERIGAKSAPKIKQKRKQCTHILNIRSLIFFADISNNATCKCTSSVYSFLVFVLRLTLGKVTYIQTPLRV